MDGADADKAGRDDYLTTFYEGAVITPCEF
jgi:hypothetical protein